jgi:Domain of unknown function (DUF5664)
MPDKTHPADPDTGAMREKLDNVPYDLVPIELIEATAEALEYGAKKYNANNWKKGLPILQVCASIVRHCFALMKGEVIDPDSGVPHVGHICANAAFLATYSKSGPWDYRPRDKMVDVKKPEAEKKLYHKSVHSGYVRQGPHATLTGDCTNIWGDCTNIRGDCSGLKGDVTDVVGNVSTLKSDVADLVDEMGNKLGK